MKDLVSEEAVVSHVGSGGIEIREREDHDAAIYLTAEDVPELLDWLVREYLGAEPKVSWYRSVLLDGTVWCESKSLGEVVERSEGMEYTLERTQSFELETDWEEFDV